MLSLDQAQLSIIQTLAVIISAVATAAAAIFVARQVSLMKQTRLVDTFLNVFNTGNQDYMREAANWVKYEMDSDTTYETAASNPKSWRHVSAINHYFEMVGVLVGNGYISEDLVFDQMGAWIAGSWEKLRPIIEAHREKKNIPDHCENFELLAARYYEWTKAHAPKVKTRPYFGQERARTYYQRRTKK